MTEYKVFLPYKRATLLPMNELPFNWLCYSRSEKTLKGSFVYVNVAGGSDLFFEEKEDMQLFVLMWGEYL